MDNFNFKIVEIVSLVGCLSELYLMTLSANQYGRPSQTWFNPFLHNDAFWRLPLFEDTPWLWDPVKSSRHGFWGVSGLIHAWKGCKKKNECFFGAFGTKKIELGGSQRGDVPPSDLGVRRGRKPPRPWRKSDGPGTSFFGSKISSNARFEISSR